ncbi:hypothetical protein TNCT_575771 [Trichonephila clavata]|uniref:Uncharacterized protein n=1 Tax=Trichonephila clavata TaxID=2740835 RepID=A0A8X6LWF3_TRICU|nr:hypothetical protein TNCT_575771 [Trichonephila clavata]
MKLDTLPSKTTAGGNIFKPVDHPNILRLVPSRSGSNSSIGSASSLWNTSLKNKSPLNKGSSQSPDNVGDDSDSNEDDEDVLSLSKLKELGNLPEEAFLRRHELYVSDIEDSHDVIFAISPTIR